MLMGGETEGARGAHCWTSRARGRMRSTCRGGAGRAGRGDVAGVGPRAARDGGHRLRPEVVGRAGRLDSLLPCNGMEFIGILDG